MRRCAPHARAFSLLRSGLTQSESTGRLAALKTEPCACCWMTARCARYLRNRVALLGWRSSHRRPSARLVPRLRLACVTYPPPRAPECRSSASMLGLRLRSLRTLRAYSLSDLLPPSSAPTSPTFGCRDPYRSQCARECLRAFASCFGALRALSRRVTPPLSRLLTRLRLLTSLALLGKRARSPQASLTCSAMPARAAP